MNNKKLFNEEAFAGLLDKAKGDRSINQYALETGVSAAHISRFLRQLVKSPPTPETISKLAEKAAEGVSYSDLMIAAGHISGPVDSGEESKSVAEEDSPRNYIKKLQALEKRFIQIILADLYTKPFKWGVEKPDGIDHMFPDMTLNIDHDGYKRWFLEFKGVVRETPFLSHRYCLDVYGRIAMTELQPTDRFTVAVNNEKLYDLFFKRPPLSLRANLYVMLIDTDKGEVVKEELLCKYA